MARDKEHPRNDWPRTRARRRAWQALAPHRVVWRDAVLDQLVHVLDKNNDTKALGGRLQRYLKAARSIEAQERGAWRGKDSVARLKEWTTERLVELEHARQDGALRHLRLRWETLTSIFADAQDDDVIDDDGIIRRPRPADLQKVVEYEAARLVRFGGRRLTPAQRTEVIATEHGALRKPRAMALHLLHLACRPSKEELKDFRRQLDRLQLRPPAL